MPRTYIRGKTEEERWNSLDRTLKSFEGRLGKKVMGIIPPVVICNSAKAPSEDGTILKSLMPLNGTLITVCFAIGKYENKKATFEVEISRRDGTSESKQFETQRKLEVVEISIPITIGDIITAKQIGGFSVTDIMIGMLIHPEINAAHIEQVMYEQIMKERENADEEKIPSSREISRSKEAQESSGEDI